MPVPSEWPMVCSCGVKYLSTEDHRHECCRRCLPGQRPREKRERDARNAGKPKRDMTSDKPAASYTHTFRRFRKRRVRTQNYARRFYALRA